MTISEKWNAIVSDYQKNKTQKEDVVQRLWQDIFADADVFGYSKRNGEIDAWRNIQIGSRERTVPDIIIRDSVYNRDLFVVELKQHNLAFNQVYKEQLFSYMRLLELNIGILICDALYIFYRENCDVEYSIEIPFTKDSTFGEKFIELFSKGNFSQKRIKEFLLQTERTRSHISQIKKELQYLDINDLLIKYFTEKYTIEEIKAAIEPFNISVELSIKNPKKQVDIPRLPVSPVIPHRTIDKSEAIRYFERLGYRFVQKPTYASKNKSANNYWANPDTAILHNDWYLILNDWISKTLYLFFIPCNSIQLSQLTVRSDNQNKIDLQIIYSDPTFTDSRSGMSFLPFLKDQIQY